MRVALYVRVSTQDQSTELQERELLEYAKTRGWTNVQVYRDKATGTNGKRVELQRMMQDARDGKLDAVVCWKLDRLFRSLKDLLNTFQELDALKVQFVCLRDNIDLSNPAGRFLMQILGAVGEFEVAMIRERVRAGLRNAKAKGKRLGAKPTLDATKIRELHKLGHSLGYIADAIGASKSGVRKVLAV